MATYCKGCKEKLTDYYFMRFFVRDYCKNCAPKSEISEHDPGAELKKEQEQMQMHHEAEMKTLGDMIKQHQAHLEQRQRIQECEHEKKPLQFTEKKLLDNDPSKLQALEEKLQLQKEIYKSELQKKMAEEEAKVKLRSKEHEQELKQRQAELQLQCDQERKMSELKTANKLSEIGTQLAQTRQEHQLSLQQMEMKHQKKIEEKDEQIKRLQQEQVKIKAELDAEFHDQNVTHMRESQRLDREWKQAGEELERKKLTEVRDLTNVLALDKQDFEKEMERERLKIREEIEKEFLDRVTTELEVEKPDGSRLTLRETQPGFVSQLADNLFGSLPTDPPSLCENRDRDTNTLQ